MVASKERPRITQNISPDHIDRLREFVLQVRDQQMKRERQGKRVGPQERNELRVISALVDQAEVFGRGMRLWFEESFNKMRPMISIFDGTAVGNSEISPSIIVGVVQSVTGDKGQRSEYYKNAIEGWRDCFKSRYRGKYQSLI